MNKQSNNYGLNKNKKTYKPTYPINQTKQKKSPVKKKDVHKNDILNKLDNYSNQPYGSSVYSKNKNNLDKMMRDYQLFVKKYLGENTPISSMKDERMNKLWEDENNKNNQYLFLDEQNNNEFMKILKNNNDLDFGDEDISIQLPSEEEFLYSLDDKLGNHKNNKNDYNRRKKLLFKDEEKNEEIVEEKKEEVIQEKHEVDTNKKDENDNVNDIDIKNDNDNDNEYDDEFEKDAENIEEIGKVEENDEKKEDEEEIKENGKVKEAVEETGENGKIEEGDGDIKQSGIIEKGDGKPNDKIEPPQNIEIIKYNEEKKEESARIIQEVYRKKKRKEKIYIGYDSTQTLILRIYIKEYDKNKKIKSIEINVYSKSPQRYYYFDKTIKELLGVDSISKKGIQKIIYEIIEKVLVQNEDTINLDELSEMQSKNKTIHDDSNKDINNIDNIKKRSKIKSSEDEIIIEKDKESVKEFVIEKNENNNNENNNNNKENNNDKIDNKKEENNVNKSNSSIIDINYDDFEEN